MAYNQTLHLQNANVDQNGRYIAGTAMPQQLGNSNLTSTLAFLKNQGLGPSDDTLKSLETEIRASALCVEPQAQAEAI